MASNVSAIAHSIYSSRKITLSGVKAAMRLPLKEQIEPQELATAIAWVLGKFFNLSLSPDQVMEIEHLNQSHFIFDSEHPPLSRRLDIDFEKTPPVMKISGSPAEDGKNGYAKVNFDWQKRSGTIKNDGTIDWKKINSFPSIEANSVIATIYNKTEGKPGLDCQGKLIKQKPGVRLKVKWPPTSIFRDNEDENAPFFNLLSQKSGVIVCEFAKNNDPATLSNIRVTEKLKINGDIDYNMGDLESAASLEIVGSVRGNFSLHSEGHIHVSDSIEGKEVAAQRVTAELITNRCRVSAVEEVETGSITNAEAKGTDILIKINAAQAILHSRNNTTFAQHAVIMGVTVKAKSVECNQNTFSGHNTIELGADLFKQVAALLPKITAFENSRAQAGSQAKEAATIILNLLPQIEKYPIAQQSTLVRNLCLSLKQAFVRSFHANRPIDEKTICQCRQLDGEIKEKTLDYSISRKVEQMCSQLPNYNQAFAELALATDKYTALKATLDDLENQIRNELTVLIKDAQLGGKNAVLTIICGEAEMKLLEKDLNNANLRICYQAPEGVLQLHKGKLRKK
ncbi:MAG: FapA family protein [Desulfobulbaceae bacterium]|nr:FapA family protein [Desulfobulbaceae bacterium]HIJ78685.1 DUF342 domain-containing protein [Deltaproteobacteria bacterium]